MSPVLLGRGPWLDVRLVQTGYRHSASWEERQPDGGIRRRSKSLGVFPGRRADGAVEALDDHFEQRGVVLAPTKPAPAARKATPGVQKGQVLSARTQELRDRAARRWHRCEERRLAAEGAVAAVLGEIPELPSVQDSSVQILEAMRGLPAGATVSVRLGDGREVRFAPSPPAPSVAADRPPRPARVEPSPAAPLGPDRVYSLHEWLGSAAFAAYLKRDYARSADKRFSHVRALCQSLPDVPLGVLATRHVEGHKDWRRRNGGLTGAGCSATTVRIELETLAIALKYAQALGLVDEVIKWSRPRWKAGSRKRIAWRLAEYERALDFARPPEQHGITRGHPPLRFSPDIHLQILLGVDGILRPGELRHLDWEDIDLSDPAPVLHVCSKPAVGWWVKTERDDREEEHDRWVPLTPRLAEALRQRWERLDRPRRGWLFPSRADPERPVGRFDGALARVCEMAGVRLLRPVELRHTGATLAARHLGFGPEDLMAVGGWTSPQIPYSTYVKRDTSAAARKMSVAAPCDEQVQVVERQGWNAMYPRRGASAQHGESKKEPGGGGG